MPKLTPEAFKIGKELLDQISPEGVIARAGIEMLMLKGEARNELREATNAIKELVRRNEKKIKELQTQTKKDAIAAAELHDAVLERMRAVQPELGLIEFSMNLEEGTYEEQGPRDEENDESAMFKQAGINLESLGVDGIPMNEKSMKMGTDVTNMFGDLMKRLRP